VLAAREFYCPDLTGANGVNYYLDPLIQQQVMVGFGNKNREKPWQSGLPL
jgi:hypothetical protein